LTWQALSVDVRWRPPLLVVVVTHLVTQSVPRVVGGVPSCEDQEQT